MFKLFDAHCHLHFPQYDADRTEVLARMQEKEMGAVLIGTDLKTSRAGIELAEKHDFFWSAVGLHPNDNIEEQFDEVAFEELARHPKVVAIGECGLDYFRSGGTTEEQSAQKIRFLKHIQLAEKVQKPLIIHCRNAHEDMIEILSEQKLSVPVIIHFCTVSGEVAQKYLDLGCYLSFPGPITYTDMYDESVRLAPLDKILAETDSPFAAPVPNRGKRNEPAFVEDVVRKIAGLKGVSFDEMAMNTVKNSSSVFSLKI
ncbi:MAG: TatD family hydrolase [Patescibacteria group bacterium]